MTTILFIKRFPAALFGTMLLFLLGSPALAMCQLVAQSGFMEPVRVKTALAPNEVRIRYIGHSTFELETPKGVRIATDYNDSIRPARTPVVPTMNRAHSTHYSTAPDPDIQHLLPGWGDDGNPVDYDLTV